MLGQGGGCWGRVGVLGRGVGVRWGVLGRGGGCWGRVGGVGAGWEVLGQGGGCCSGVGVVGAGWGCWGGVGGVGAGWGVLWRGVVAGWVELTVALALLQLQMEARPLGGCGALRGLTHAAGGSGRAGDDHVTPVKPLIHLTPDTSVTASVSQAVAAARWSLSIIIIANLFCL